MRRMSWFMEKIVRWRVMVLVLLVWFQGCALFNKKENTLRLHEEVSSALPSPRVRQVELPSAGGTITVSPYAVLTERELEGVQLVATASTPVIMLKFDPHGTVLLDEATTRVRGQRLVVFINDQPVMIWPVRERIVNGQFLLRLDWPSDDIRTLATTLQERVKKNQAR